jgi:hypothetical protein
MAEQNTKKRDWNAADLLCSGGNSADGMLEWRISAPPGSRYLLLL